MNDFNIDTIEDNEIPTAAAVDLITDVEQENELGEISFYFRNEMVRFPLDPELLAKSENIERLVAFMTYEIGHGHTTRDELPQLLKGVGFDGNYADVISEVYRMYLRDLEEVVTENRAWYGIGQMQDRIRSIKLTLPTQPQPEN